MGSLATFEILQSKVERLDRKLKFQNPSYPVTVRPSPASVFPPLCGSASNGKNPNPKLFQLDPLGATTVVSISLAAPASFGYGETILAHTFRLDDPSVHIRQVRPVMAQ